jgi:nucleotide sugar dehydrogenase
MAEAGFEVIGVESLPDVVEALNAGKPHFHEAGLVEALQSALRSGKLRVCTEIPRQCEASVYILSVGTPIDDAHEVRLDTVTHASHEVAERFTDGAMIVLRSTVRLGVTRNLVAPILRATGRTFDLAFCPERTVEGQALTELHYLPQIVGGYDYESTVRAAQMFQFITPTVVKVSTLEVAETVKLIDNVMRDVAFGFSNEVARICDAAGVNAAEVIQTGNLGYPRRNIYMPGPVGGPCLAKDSYILIESLKPLGVKPEMTEAARKGNERQLIEAADYIAGVIEECCVTQNPTIALLGIAFKGRPETEDLRGTTARPVYERLKGMFPKARFRGYDPVVPPDAMTKFGVEPSSSLEDAFHGSQVAIILNNHPRFASMPLARLAEGMQCPAFIYDFWNNFSAKQLDLPNGVGYAAIGCHVDAILPKLASGDGETSSLRS